MKLKKYISFPEAADLMGCRRTNIYHHIARTELEVFEVPPLKLLLRSDIQKLIRKKRHDKLIKLKRKREKIRRSGKDCDKLIKMVRESGRAVDE